ncbi:MAG: Anti-sigma factor RskA [Acidimicrobiales bacterium]|nr:Anti-sigma factor RskA [Acidimicrobiales bacterium]
MSTYEDDFTELLGAYALDAVDPEERERIEVHLRTCPWCAAEVAEHRETAAFLSHSGTDAPEGVWDRIAAELSPPAPPLRMSFSPSGEVDPLDPAGSATQLPGPPEAPGRPTVVPFGRRTVPMRIFTAVLAAAACLLVALGIAITVDRGGNSGGPGDENANTELEVKLKGSSKLSGIALVDSSGKGHLVAPELPDPGEGDLYQLWGQVDGVVISLGTFGADTDSVPFQVDPEHLDKVQAFMVTEEKVPGVPSSSNEPVIVGAVA